MFRKHRNDLLDAMERERAAWKMVVTVLADQVEFLRYQVTQAPHMSVALRDLAEKPVMTTASPAADGFRPYLTEDEEELLAARLNGHIDEAELRAFAEELNIPVPSLEPDE